MTERFERGESVQVWSIWAYASPEPLSHWFGGYTVAADAGGDNVQVKQELGLFAGVVVTVERRRVRRRMMGPLAPEAWQKRWPYQDLENSIEALARVEAVTNQAKNS